LPFALKLLGLCVENAFIGFANSAGITYNYSFSVCYKKMNIFALLFQDGVGGSWGILLPLVAMVGIFYFLVIRPQKRQQQEMQEMITQLKSGDEVVTSGGIIGKIKEVRDTSFIIQSAEKSFIEIGKNAVIGRKPEKQ
jgi:preprotein translocase subunit YajC